VSGSNILLSLADATANGFTGDASGRWPKLLARKRVDKMSLSTADEKRLNQDGAPAT